MAKTPDQFHQEVEDWAKELISQLSKAERRKLARHIGTRLRRANAKRIRAQEGPNGEAWPPRRPRNRRGSGGSRGKMLLGFSKAKYMKVKLGDGGVMVGFWGHTARLARVHQYGLRSKVGPHGPRVRYPERPLLGFSHADREMIRDLIVEWLDNNQTGL